MPSAEGYLSLPTALVGVVWPPSKKKSTVGLGFRQRKFLLSQSQCVKCSDPFLTNSLIDSPWFLFVCLFVFLIEGLALELASKSGRWGRG
jgi:hypothetical protein